MIKRKKRNDSQLIWFLGQMWIEYGDKKNFTYYLNVDINVYYKDLEEFIYFEREELFSKVTFNSFSDMALNLLCLEIDKVNNYEIYCEKFIKMRIFLKIPIFKYLSVHHHR